MPAPTLDPEQQKVLRRILSIARQVGASPKEIKAAVETGLVESNLRNLPGGDADSAGWRQERASLYPDPTNLDASIRRFFQETSAVRGQHGRAGDLAAAVQRPAAQYRSRYQANSDEADALLGRTSGRTGSGSQSRQASRGATRTVGGVDNRSARGALIAAFLQGGDRRFTQGTGAEGMQTTDPLRLALGLRQLKDTPGRQVTTPARGSSASTSSSSSGRYPLGKRGQVIGTPNAGTHTLGNWQSDRAYDIKVPVGTPMIALQDGVVVKVTKHPQGAGRFAGDQITIRGANGNEYFYAHGVATVKAGQRIRKGQSIGVSGSANGVPHLHFGQMRGNPDQHL